MSKNVAKIPIAMTYKVYAVCIFFETIQTFPVQTILMWLGQGTTKNLKAGLQCYKQL